VIIIGQAQDDAAAVNGSGAETRAWRIHPSNRVMIGFVFLVYAAIMLSFSSHTFHLDEIKTTLLFLLMPVTFLGFFVALYRGEAAPLPRIVWMPLLAYGAVLCLSGLQAYFPWRAWYSIGWYWCVFAPVLVIPSCVKSARQFLWLAHACVALALVVIVFGLFHYFGGFVFLRDVVFSQGPPAGGGSRLYDLINTFAQSRDMTSTTMNSDFYGAYLLMSAPLALNLFAAPFRSVWTPILGLITGILAAISLLLTESNDSQGVAVMVAVFYAVMIVRAGVVMDRRRRRLIALLAAGALIIAGTTAYMRWPQLGPQIRSVEGAVSSRDILWRGAWKMFLEDPVWGQGPGAYFLRFPKYRPKDFYQHEIADVTLTAHNMYLGSLAEEGALGLAALLVFLGGVVFLGLRQIGRVECPIIRTHQIGLTAAILGVSIQNFFSPNARWTVCGVSFSMLLGLSIACAMLELHEEHRPRWPGAARWGRRAGALGILIAGPLAIVLFGFGARYWKAASHHIQGVRASTQGDVCASAGDKDAAAAHYYQAIAEFGAAIQWWAGYVSSYYKMAYACAAVGQYDEALGAYETLATYAPDYSDIHRNIGIVCQSLAARTSDPAQRDYWTHRAIDALRTHIRDVSDRVEAHEALAYALREAAHRSPGASESQRRAWRQEALETLCLAATLDYTHAGEKRAQAALRLRLATELNERIQSLNPVTDGAQRRQCLQWLVEILQRLASENGEKNADLMSKLITALRERGQGDQGKRILDERIAEDPGNLAYRSLRAQHCSAMGQWAEASRQYEGLFKAAHHHRATDPILDRTRILMIDGDNVLNRTAPAEMLLAAIDMAWRAGDSARAHTLTGALAAFAPASNETRIAREWIEKGRPQ